MVKNSGNSRRKAHLSCFQDNNTHRTAFFLLLFYLIVKPVLRFIKYEGDKPALLVLNLQYFRYVLTSIKHYIYKGFCLVISQIQVVFQHIYIIYQLVIFVHTSYPLDR